MRQCTMKGMIESGARLQDWEDLKAVCRESGRSFEVYLDSLAALFHWACLAGKTQLVKHMLSEGTYIRAFILARVSNSPNRSTIDTSVIDPSQLHLPCGLSDRRGCGCAPRVPRRVPIHGSSVGGRCRKTSSRTSINPAHGKFLKHG